MVKITRKEVDKILREEVKKAREVYINTLKELGYTEKEIKEQLEIMKKVKWPRDRWHYGRHLTGGSLSLYGQRY